MHNGSGWLSFECVLKHEIPLGYLGISTTEVGGIRDVAQLFWGNICHKQV